MKQLLVAMALLAAGAASAAPISTRTPIRHLVVIFQENVSFDHYFGTYPHAANPPNEPPFHALPGTPGVNGLTHELIANNPNGVAPFRLDRDQAVTCDQDHHYTAEQYAYHGGLVDRFLPVARKHAGPDCDPTLVMGYYDGNTVTALWNYAQHFAISDNSFGSTFGPSTPGAINLISGQTHGAAPNIEDHVVDGTLIADPDPAFDDCSRYKTVAFSGRNVGNLLNAGGVTWGWFQGGFRPSARLPGGAPVCGTVHKNAAGKPVHDYVAHHDPFQYYQSTSNPDHLPPTSVAAIGHDGPANHQYALRDFWDALDSGHLPAVSFLKAPGYEDGHAGYSGPIDAQRFLVATINRLQRSKYWSSMAIIVAWDDSDGWYDHVMPPIVNHSADPRHDVLFGEAMCGKPDNDAYPDRCGYGPRLPLLVISPWAKRNFVDSTLTDQVSILRFIEDNWNLGRIGDQSFDARAGSLGNLFDFSKMRMRRLILDPRTGEPSPVKAPSSGPAATAASGRR
ncbi:MAG TPA: alkaline phosphatase family protein [Gammaproteobacteria bacterium]|nr:alkaline phosphatase family protein [Gammaproteobacteria bacterium]